MFNVPSQVKVGPHLFEVVGDQAEWARVLREQGNPDLLAVFLGRENRIYYDSHQHGTQQADSILHEVLHAVCASVNLPAVLAALREDADQEEILVSLLAPSLLQVLRDNEDLVQFLRTV